MKIIQKIIIPLIVLISITIFPVSNTAKVYASEKETLVVGVPTDRCPVFYIDPKTEEIVGIGTELMQAVVEEAGYNVYFKAITEKTNKDALDNPEYDIIIPFGSAIKSSSGKDTIVTDNLIKTPFTMVTKNNKHIILNDSHIGMLSSLAGAAESVQQLYPGVEITLYDTMPECVKALRNDEVDALMHNSYVWSYILQKPSYSDLSVQVTTMFSMDFRAGTVDTPEGRILIDRLNTSIDQLDDTRKQAIILDYTSRRLYQYDFWDYVYEYRYSLVIGSILLILSVIYIIRRQHAMYKEQEEKIRKLREQDPLTGVLNLEGFKKHVEKILRTHPENQYFLAFCNIKNFKFINESMGREAGDELLCFWAQNAIANFSDEEAIGRITGDRFAVLRKITDTQQMLKDTKTIFEPVQNYFIDRGKETKIQTCSGIYAITADDYDNIDVDKMLDYARIAEKKAESSFDTGYEFYNPQQWEKGKQIIEINGHFPAAIQSGEIQVWYQPQVDYATGKINGAEALCRWKHSKLGWISPATFIPVLEETGAIFDLDRFVWEKVCQDLHKWNEEGQKRSVSVNLSRSDIKDNVNIPGLFYELIQKYDIEPKQLKIEITETAYVESPDVLIRITSELREYGFQVEMDDFGSGYSSLHMLKEVPVDRIKMDLHFLSGSGDVQKGQIIITQVIKLVELLGIKLIAEGVETQSQADFLKEKGCQEMQGYYFYKPMPVEDFVKQF